MIEIRTWMEQYRQAVLSAFADRVVFIGLQGSYGRGEAIEQSDIDVVLILDQLQMKDLMVYKRATAALPYRERLCGFVSGKAELAHWCKWELFQFYHDTKAVQGDLSSILPPLTIEDAWQAVQAGACTIYHACSHNFLYAMDKERLQALYKSAVFVLQAKYYCQKGRYVGTRKELKAIVQGEDMAILQAAMESERITEETLEQDSALLLKWAGGLIRKE